jgi:thioredoxin reductase
MCRRKEIVLVGGGNSAGQAAIFLSSYATRITMLVRSNSLTESMSRYLIDRIEAISNIDVLTSTQIAALCGSPGGQLERVRWRNNKTGAETEKPIRNVFLLSEWIQRPNGCATAAFFLTVKDSCVPAPAWHPTKLLQTSRTECRWNPV